MRSYRVVVRAFIAFIRNHELKGVYGRAEAKPLCLGTHSSLERNPPTANVYNPETAPYQVVLGGLVIIYPFAEVWEHAD